MTTSPPSKLGRAIAATAGPATKLRTALETSPVREPYTIRLQNGATVDCVMLIVGGERLIELEAESRARMAYLGYVLDDETEGRYELLYAAYVLAEACVDPADGSPVGSRDDWSRRMSAEAINAAWIRFADLRHQHDPLADDVRITKEEFAAIQLAIEEKKSAQLRHFGLAKLCVYLLITAAQQSISQTLKSLNGQPSQDSSLGQAPTAADPGDTAT